MMLITEIKLEDTMTHRSGPTPNRPMLLTAFLLVAVVMALLLACAQDPDLAGPSGGVGDLAIFHHGLSPLEEQIADSDVIVRAQLQSVTSGTTRWDPDYWGAAAAWTGDDVTHVGTLHHSFTVLEYLKGTGDDQIVAVVLEDSLFGRSAGDAAADGAALLAARDTQWDSREAILLLEKSYGPTLDFPQADRYLLGSVITSRGALGDFYTIASPNDKTWLPAASQSTGGRSGSRPASTTKRFLLDVPTGREAGAARAASRSGSDSSSIITLAQMKTKIQEIEQQVAQGDGSEAYRNCIYEKLRAERDVRSRIEAKGQITVRRYNANVASGLAAGTTVWTSPYAGLVEHDYGKVQPADYGRFHLRDNDAELFTPRYPGEVLAVRPLLAGTYRFFFDVEFAELIPCDGQPEEDKRNTEVFVTVTAPEGVAHEAFFDPVSSGDSVGYFGTGDALKPTTFITGDATTTVQSLKWQDSAVILGLQPYDALEEHSLDFITGDGTTTLSLQGAAATGDSTSGTLTWAVGSQPWSSGDELMLRIRDSNTPPTFAQDAYTFSVAESTSAFTVIGTVKAVDQDGDTVLHKITGGNEGGRFSIDGWEGFILVSGRLDYETSTSYELTVTGTDPGGRSDSTTVTIEVTDVAE